MYAGVKRAHTVSSTYLLFVFIYSVQVRNISIYSSYSTFLTVVAVMCHFLVTCIFWAAQYIEFISHQNKHIYRLSSHPSIPSNHPLAGVFLFQGSWGGYRQSYLTCLCQYEYTALHTEVFVLLTAGVTSIVFSLYNHYWLSLLLFQCIT